MAYPTEFEGQSTIFGPPPGQEEEIGSLPVFGNGVAVVSCWQLDPEELQAVIASGGKVWISVLSGSEVFPTFVGSEDTCRQVVERTGKVWQKSEG